MTKEELEQYDNEAKHFAKGRDLNKDGKMDKVRQNKQNRQYTFKF